jgi:hypothetical protein
MMDVSAEEPDMERLEGAPLIGKIVWDEEDGMARIMWTHAHLPSNFDQYGRKQAELTLEMCKDIVMQAALLGNAMLEQMQWAKDEMEH